MPPNEELRSRSAGEGWLAAAKSGGRSEDSLRATWAGERPEESGEGAADTVHCWDSKGDSCLEVNMR